MDKIINWLLLVIIFVFDPLAISLVIAANFAFDKAYPKKKYKENLYGEEVEDTVEDTVESMRKVVDSYDDLQDEISVWDSTLNDGLEDMDNEEWEAAEKRMEIIGQNGNDGEHYKEIEVDPSLTLTRRDGKQVNLKDYIQQFRKPLKVPNDDETKTY